MAAATPIMIAVPVKRTYHGTCVLTAIFDERIPILLRIFRMMPRNTIPRGQSDLSEIGCKFAISVHVPPTLYLMERLLNRKLSSSAFDQPAFGCDSSSQSDSYGITGSEVRPSVSGSPNMMFMF